MWCVWKKGASYGRRRGCADIAAPHPAHHARGNGGPLRTCREPAHAGTPYSCVVTAAQDLTAGTADPAYGPSLDRDTDVWLGTFPGLGAVRVNADGAITVDVANAADLPADECAARERALRFGWGEPLSFARRGFRCTGGAAAVPPLGGSCLLLHGEPHDTAIILLELARRGWTIMGDRFTPIEWHGDTLLAHAREAPILVSRRRAEKAGISGVSVREHSDALIVDLPRDPGSHKVEAVVLLQTRKPEDVRLAPLMGHERFAAAANLTIGGALSPHGLADRTMSNSAAADDPPPEAFVTEHLKLAALPFARLSIDTAGVTDDADALVAWWQTITAGSSDTAS